MKELYCFILFYFMTLHVVLPIFSDYLDFVNSTKYRTERHTAKIIGCSYQLVLVSLNRRRKILRKKIIWYLAKFVAKVKWLHTIHVNIQYTL